MRLLIVAILLGTLQLVLSCGISHGSIKFRRYALSGLVLGLSFAIGETHRAYSSYKEVGDALVVGIMFLVIIELYFGVLYGLLLLFRRLRHNRPPASAYDRRDR